MLPCTFNLRDHRIFSLLFVRTYYVGSTDLAGRRAPNGVNTGVAYGCYGLLAQILRQIQSKAADGELLSLQNVRILVRKYHMI